MRSSCEDIAKYGVPKSTPEQIASRLNDMRGDGHILLLDENPLKAAQALEPLLETEVSFFDASAIENLPELAVRLRNLIAKNAGREEVAVPDEPEDTEANWHARYQWFAKSVDWFEEAEALAKGNSADYQQERQNYQTIFVTGMTDDVADRFKRFRENLWGLGHYAGLIVIAPPEQVNWYLYLVSDSWCFPHGVRRLVAENQ